MGLLKKHIKEDKPKGAVVVSIDISKRGLPFLIEFINKIRPGSHTNIQLAELNFRAMLYTLQQDPYMLITLRRSLLSLLLRANIVPTLTESGLSSSRGFIQELGKKMRHKFLPAIQHRNDFLFVLDRVFYKETDFKWVEGVDKDLWKSLFGIIGFEIDLQDEKLLKQLGQSLQILSYRLANAGLEEEIQQRFDFINNAAYPFLEQNRLIGMFLEKYHVNASGEERKILVNNIAESLHNCKQSLLWLKDQRINEGTSLAQTFLMLRMEQNIERLLLIMDVLDFDQDFDIDRFIGYFCTVVKFENTKNSVSTFLSDNLSLLAYQIAEHKGRKGEQFIAFRRRDFLKLFNSAMIGGFIISFIAIFKNLLSKLPSVPFWQGFLYGTNYAFGFVMMDQVGGTLATKQPAYTASSIAGSLDVRKNIGEPDLKNLAVMVSRVSRSQIASFAGNLIIVFPLTYILAISWHWMTGVKLASGDAALKLLSDQHPFQSLSLLYACFTGFFLFLSGIIAGYIENSIVFDKVPERMATHPVFSQTMSPKRLSKLVDFIRKNSGTMAGSISLGFFLGFAGPIGKIIGLPFDIRHITISAGNTAIGFYGLDHPLPIKYMIEVIVGVLVIGLLNFLVSFSLAFYVALRSRGIQIKDYPLFIQYVWKYFKTHP
ncbi:MAG: hypothetical protein ACO29O_02430, partial [Chitinophagaceae bacterium]